MSEELLLEELQEVQLETKVEEQKLMDVSRDIRLSFGNDSIIVNINELSVENKKYVGKINLISEDGLFYCKDTQGNRYPIREENLLELEEMALELINESSEEKKSIKDELREKMVKESLLAGEMEVYLKSKAGEALYTEISNSFMDNKQDVLGKLMLVNKLNDVEYIENFFKNYYLQQIDSIRYKLIDGYTSRIGTTTVSNLPEEVRKKIAKELLNDKERTIEKEVAWKMYQNVSYEEIIASGNYNPENLYDMILKQEVNGEKKQYEMLNELLVNHDMDVKRFVSYARKHFKEAPSFELMRKYHQINKNDIKDLYEMTEVTKEDVYKFIEKTLQSSYEFENLEDALQNNILDEKDNILVKHWLLRKDEFLKADHWWHVDKATKKRTSLNIFETVDEKDEQKLDQAVDQMIMNKRHSTIFKLLNRNDISKEIVKKISDWTESIEEESITMSLLSNLNCPVEILQKYCLDKTNEFPSYAMIVARNESTNTEILLKMEEEFSQYGEYDFKMMKAIIENKNYPIEKKASSLSEIAYMEKLATAEDEQYLSEEYKKIDGYPNGWDKAFGLSILHKVLFSDEIAKNKLVADDTLYHYYLSNGGAYSDEEVLEIVFAHPLDKVESIYSDMKDDLKTTIKLLKINALDESIREQILFDYLESLEAGVEMDHQAEIKIVFHSLEESYRTEYQSVFSSLQENFLVKQAGDDTFEGDTQTRVALKEFKENAINDEVRDEILENVVKNEQISKKLVDEMNF
jgi:hypothetical protein